MSVDADPNTIPIPDQVVGPEQDLGGTTTADLSSMINPGGGQASAAPTLPSAGTATPSTSAPSQADQNAANVTGAIGKIGNLLATDTNTKGALAANEYSAQDQQWKSSMPYWFDPSRDVAPDINRLMSEMPTRTQTMDQQAKSGGVLTNVLDPSTLISQNVGGRLGAQAAYASSKGVTGMEQGASAGSSLGIVGTVVGGIAGGIIGMFDGFFGYGNAADQDAKDRATRLAELQAALKEWNIEREKLLESKRSASIEQNKADAQADQAKKQGAFQTKKQQMMSIMQQFSNVRRTGPQAAPTIGSPSIAA